MKSNQRPIPYFLTLFCYGLALITSAAETISVEDVSPEDIAEVVITLPEEERSEFTERWFKLQHEKWQEEFKRNYDEGKLPDQGNSFIGTWVDKHWGYQLRFKSDGTYDYHFGDPNRRSGGNWRVGKSGATVLKSPAGNFEIAVMTKDVLRLFGDDRERCVVPFPRYRKKED